LFIKFRGFKKIYMLYLGICLIILGIAHKYLLTPAFDNIFNSGEASVGNYSSIVLIIVGVLFIVWNIISLIIRRIKI